MHRFRVLHVSDLHIATTPRGFGLSDWKHYFKYHEGTPGLVSSFDTKLALFTARIAFIQGNRLDAVLISGDLATTGSASDLDLAHKYIDAPARGGSWLSESDTPTLQAAGVPVILIPGNHDRYNGWRKAAGGSRFDKMFLDYWLASRRVQTLVVLQGGANEKLAFIAADLTLASSRHAKGKWGYLGQGKAYRTVLGALVEETQFQRKLHGTLGIVWVLHFPPEFPNLADTLGLLEDQRVGKAAAEAGITHLFCGHTHEPLQYNLLSNPSIRVHCAGTATQYCSPAGNFVHITEIDVNGDAIESVDRVDLTVDPQAVIEGAGGLMA